MGCWRGEAIASSGILVLFFNTRSWMHGIMYYICVLRLADDMEAQVLKSSPQTNAPGNPSRAKARPTQDRRRGLRRQRGQGVG